MPLNNQIQIRRVKLNIIKVNPLDVDHIENSQCRLGWCTLTRLKFAPDVCLPQE